MAWCTGPPLFYLEILPRITDIERPDNNNTAVQGIDRTGQKISSRLRRNP
jgi:hypothetical protein